MAGRAEVRVRAGSETAGGDMLGQVVGRADQRPLGLDLAEAQLERLSSQLAKYLSPQVYESIFAGRQEVKISATRKKLTVFFSDIADFTETAERLASEELTQLLNHDLTEMSQIALRHGATIDKHVGDAIVIFFGDPETRGVQEDSSSGPRGSASSRFQPRMAGEIKQRFNAGEGNRDASTGPGGDPSFTEDDERHQLNVSWQYWRSYGD